MITARRVELEDWEAVKFIWSRFKESKFADRIYGDLTAIKAFFISSLQPGAIAVWIAHDENRAVGFLITHLTHEPNLGPGGIVQLLPHRFIRGVYTESFIATQVLSSALEEHARAEGCVAIYGNCRLDFPGEAAMRSHGYEAVSKQLRKELV